MAIHSSLKRVLITRTLRVRHSCTGACGEEALNIMRQVFGVRIFLYTQNGFRGYGRVSAVDPD